MVDRIFMMFEFRAIKLCKQKSKKCYQFFQLQITYYILAFFVKKPFSGNFFSICLLMDWREIQTS